MPHRVQLYMPIPSNTIISYNAIFQFTNKQMNITIDIVSLYLKKIKLHHVTSHLLKKKKQSTGRHILKY